jgi:hypothetical protein
MRTTLAIRLCALGLSAASCGARLPSSSPTGVPPVTMDAASTRVPTGDPCDETPRMLANARALHVDGAAGPLSAHIGAIAVHGSDVYYTAWGVSFAAGANSAVMRVPRVGGASTVIASGFEIGASAITDTQVVFTAQPSPQEDAIITVPLAGGTPTIVATFSVDLTNGVAADDDFAYFTRTGGMYAVPLNAGAGSASPVTITTQVPSHQLPDGLGLFGNQLIFGWSQGGLESVPLPPRADSPVTTLGAGHEGGMLIVPSGPSSAWLAWAGYDLQQIDPQGNVLSTLSTGALPWCDLAFDGTAFFAVGNGPTLYGNLVPGFLARISVADGAITTLGTMEDASDVAVDDQCVYWASAAGLFSLAKTAPHPFALDGVPPPAAADAGASPAADADACMFQSDGGA